MKLFSIALIMLTSTMLAGQNGQATTIKKTFSRETSVSIDIQADPSIIWSLLTNAEDYPRWNSTILSLEGTIAEGEKIRLQSTLDPERTFKLKVKEVAPESRLVWGDGKGKRIYTLEDLGNGNVRFSMNEKIGGLMFPMYAKYIPDFDASFEQFAADLQREAELIQNQ